MWQPIVRRPVGVGEPRSFEALAEPQEARPSERVRTEPCSERVDGPVERVDRAVEGEVAPGVRLGIMRGHTHRAARVLRVMRGVTVGIGCGIGCGSGAEIGRAHV